MEYDIVKGVSIPNLMIYVNRKLDEGWEPTGGVVYDQMCGMYVQAVFRKKDIPLLTERV